jgi:predicted ester cyclase
MNARTQTVENEATIRQLYAYINCNRAESLASIIDSGYQDHSNGGQGLQAFIDAVANLHRAYADLRFDLAEVLTQGDMVAVRWVETGRHVAPFFDLKPTGKPFEAGGITLFRLRDGKVVENWQGIDPSTIRAQQKAQAALALVDP